MKARGRGGRRRREDRPREVEEDDVEEGEGSAPLDFSKLNPGQPSRFPTFVERYMSEYRSARDGWQYVYQHSNGVVVMGVSKEHPLTRETVKGVQWADGVLHSRVSGTKKHGGLFVEEGTVVLTVQTEQGNEYVLRGCVRGTLLEYNPEIESRPSLLSEKSDTEGWLIIVNPHHGKTLEELGLTKIRDKC